MYIIRKMEYPSYQDIEEYVMTRPEYLEHWSEYSETNHARMAQIFGILWRTRDGPELRSMKVSKLGLQILHGGGMTAMCGCYYVFVAALRVLRERPAASDAILPDLLELRRRLAWMWEGLGEWQG